MALQHGKSGLIEAKHCMLYLSKQKPFVKRQPCSAMPFRNIPFIVSFQVK